MRSVQARGRFPLVGLEGDARRGRLCEQIGRNGRGQPAEFANLQALQANMPGGIVRALAIAAVTGIERDCLPRSDLIARVEDARPNGCRRR